MELTSIIVSGIVWDAIKNGMSITTDFLKKKLSKWILDDAALEEIKKFVCSIPESYLVSEGMIKEYINLNDKFLELLKTAKPTDIEIDQNVKCNQGIIIGANSGTVNLNNYSNCEEPKPAGGRVLPLIESQVKYHPIQIVKSFSSTRDKCVVENKTVLRADIVIPEKIKKKKSSQFSMILFSYIPSENWLNYVDDNYKMRFILETSTNIKQVQLQVKNCHQQQFLDIPVYSGEFLRPLSELAQRTAWKDVCEICFTVFADDKYIQGEKGFIQLKGFQLEK